MRRQVIPLGPTSGAGAFTSDTQGSIIGLLYAIEYIPGTIDTGATVTVTCEGDASKPLLTKSSAGTSALFFYPRDLVHAVVDGAALTGAAGGDRAMPVLAGWVKVVIASGGDTKSGSLIVYYEPEI